MKIVDAIVFRPLAFFRVLTGALFLIAGFSASGAVLHWNTGDGVWNQASNWLPAQVPTAADDVVFGHGVIGLSGDRTVNSIHFQSGSPELSDDTLTIASGSLSVTDGNPLFLGPVVVGANAVWHVQRLNNSLIAGDGIFSGGGVNRLFEKTGAGRVVTNGGDLGNLDVTQGRFDAFGNLDIRLGGTSVVVGRLGNTGTLLVPGNARLNLHHATARIELGSSLGSTGVLRIEGQVQPGIVNASEIRTGSGTGRLGFAHTSQSYFFTRDGTVDGDPAKIGTGTDVRFESGRTIVVGAPLAPGFFGVTTIGGGTLQIGADGAPGSYAGMMVNDGTLVLANAVMDGYTAMSGSGVVRKESDNTFMLTGAFGHTGGTEIVEGQFIVGPGGTLAGDVVNHGALVFHPSGNSVFAGDVSGPGSIGKTGDGVLELRGSVAHGSQVGRWRGVTARRRGSLSYPSGILFVEGGTTDRPTFVVAEGTTADFDQVQIGVGASEGRLEVSGTESMLIVREDFHLAGGEVEIAGGGWILSPGTFRVEPESDDGGTVVIRGEGSRVHRSGDHIAVGEASLTLEDGGRVSFDVGGVVRLGEGGTHGVLNIGAPLGESHRAPGIMTGEAIESWNGTGSVVFNHTGENYVFSRDGTAGTDPVVIRGAVDVRHQSGVTVLAGDQTYTGGTVVTGGTLLLNTILPGDLFVDDEATVGGDGGVAGLLTLTDESTLSPGASVGVFRAGEWNWEDGVYLWEIADLHAGPGVGWDLVEVDGPISFVGGFEGPVLAIRTLTAAETLDSLDGFDPGATYRWTVVRFNQTGAPNPLPIGQSDLSLSAPDDSDLIFDNLRVLVVEEVYGSFTHSLVLEYRVLPPPLSYEDWISGFDLAAGQQAPTADPDGDGVPNLLEFILGGDPTIPMSAPLPISGIVNHQDSDYLALTFFQRDWDESSSSPFYVAVDESYDLQEWLSHSGDWESTRVGAPVGFWRVTWFSDIPVSEADRIFLRLRAWIAPEFEPPEI